MARKWKYAHYAARSYTALPASIQRELVERGAHRNAWAVLCTLMRWAREDGVFRAMTRETIGAHSGLTSNQVRTGMEELKKIGLIEPVKVKRPDGSWADDRGRRGHAASYRIPREIWKLVALDEKDVFTEGVDTKSSDWKRHYD